MEGRVSDGLTLVQVPAHELCKLISDKAIDAMACKKCVRRCWAAGIVSLSVEERRKDIWGTSADDRTS